MNSLHVYYIGRIYLSNVHGVSITLAKTDNGAHRRGHASILHYTGALLASLLACYTRSGYVCVSRGLEINLPPPQTTRSHTKIVTKSNSQGMQEKKKVYK